jgi:glycolate oxidase
MIPDEYIEGSEALLLIEVDGDEETTVRHAGKLKKLCGELGAVTYYEAVEAEDREQLWQTRRSLSPAIMKIRPLKINEDVSVPRMKIPELIEGIEKIGQAREVTIVNFGHAGDGNVHVNILVDPDDEAEVARGKEAVEDLFDLTVSLGGSLSGEHGIGIAKAPFFHKEIGNALQGAMAAIKRALDPNDILNPGKTFDYDSGSAARELP